MESVKRTAEISACRIVTTLVSRPLHRQTTDLNRLSQHSKCWAIITPSAARTLFDLVDDLFGFAMLLMETGITCLLKKLFRLAPLLIAAIFVVSCSSTESSSPGLGALPKAMGAADETAAIQTLRTIASAETQFKAGTGAYGSFDGVVQAGFLDQRFAGSAPNLRGYRFAIRITESSYSINADPQTSETQPTTGSRHFYLDSADGVIHVNTTGSASPADPGLNQ
jgi:hypothetical protein